MGEPRGGYTVAEEDHRQPWFKYRGNPNYSSADVKMLATSEWEREIAKLKAKAIAVEELKVYVLERQYVSGNERINAINKEIVNKLNTIGGYRRQWFMIKVDSGNTKMLKKILNLIEVQKSLVIDAQRSVQHAGGRWIGVRNHA